MPRAAARHDPATNEAIPSSRVMLRRWSWQGLTPSYRLLLVACLAVSGRIVRLRLVCPIDVHASGVHRPSLRGTVRIFRPLHTGLRSRTRILGNGRPGHGCKCDGRKERFHVPLPRLMDDVAARQLFRSIRWLHAGCARPDDSKEEAHALVEPSHHDRDALLRHDLSSGPAGPSTGSVFGLRTLAMRLMASGRSFVSVHSS